MVLEAEKLAGINIMLALPRTDLALVNERDLESPSQISVCHVSGIEIRCTVSPTAAVTLDGLKTSPAVPPTMICWFAACAWATRTEAARSERDDVASMADRQRG